MNHDSKCGCPDCYERNFGCTCPDRLYDPGSSEPNDSTCELSEEQHEQLAKAAERQECPQCFSIVRDERHCVYGWHLCKNKWHNELLEAGDQKIAVGTWVNMGGFVAEIRGNEAVVRVDGNCFILSLKSIWNPEFVTAPKGNENV